MKEIDWARTIKGISKSMKGLSQSIEGQIEMATSLKRYRILCHTCESRHDCENHNEFGIEAIHCNEYSTER